MGQTRGSRKGGYGKGLLNCTERLRFQFRQDADELVHHRENTGQHTIAGNTSTKASFRWERARHSGTHSKTEIAQLLELRSSRPA